ncbi:MULTISPECIES: transglutaminase-like domain-containing protein [Rhodobacterales]|uniref:Transglutaminase n=4 Tax=Rhodobacterales TaxID=204455 RepID=A0A0L1JKU5_9RHOB|nr:MULTISPECIES: transglutaminase-like domain-containing protein [Rhodobacterales]ANP43520.1 transglutaminase [Tritonibacter mobilis F1926]KAF0675606.1 Transglutaminase-like superfamily domain containing protein [Profundibacterium mesophilum KAUST100406-0324]KJZ22757.1 transglutaminase [Tritonibacter mobilis]KNG92018.1 transglutaminase [Pseudaestuariivita atlantica]KUP93689.1 transglutaminase-like superfamily protein [Tritonibacter horizontis]
MNPADPHLAKTRLLDFDATSIAKLIEERGWADLPSDDRIGAIYDFVRNEITFGYNRADDIPASEVLADGHGQCNTKGTLLMALLRGVGVRCRLHGFTIHKALQRGVVPELVYPLAPSEILHSWVEVDLGDGWVNLEGFILDAPFLQTLQQKFRETDSLCGYGVGTECLSAPPVTWSGNDTYIQKTGIVRDLGTFNAPDDFYSKHRQNFGFVRDLLYRHVIRHWMNARVRRIRRGILPPVPGFDRPNHRHEETNRAA